MDNSFLKDLLAFESGIDPKKFDWYVENLDKIYIKYPLVLSPGCLVRCHETGRPIYKNITVREYFTILGVMDRFVKDDPSCIFDMQYRVINPWGFVGYQLGEGVLISNNYYEPEIIDNCPRFYIKLDEKKWSSGIREREVIGLDYCSKILATDTNQWKGRFTGRDGVCCFEDLLDPCKQTKVIVNVLLKNYNDLNFELRNKKIELSTKLKLGWTISGIIAGTYLCGVSRIIDMLINDRDVKDEMNTSAYKYILKFSGYDIQKLIAV